MVRWLLLFVLGLLAFSVSGDRYGADLFRDAACRSRVVGGYMCPELLLLGVQKSGTTSLFTWIRKTYPMIKTKKFYYGKEAHFFDRDQAYEKGPGWYATNYPIRKSHTDIALDATPNYIGCSGAPQRIQQTLMNERLRFIVVFKDPVKRAWSWYQHSLAVVVHNNLEMFCQYGAHNLHFTEMVATVPPVIAKCLASAPKGKRFSSCAHDSGRWPASNKFECQAAKVEPWTAWMFTTGLYGPILEHWLRYFPPEKFCMTIYDDLLNHMSSNEKYLRPCFEPFGIDFRIPEKEILPRISIQRETIQACHLCEEVPEAVFASLRRSLNRILYSESNREFRKLMVQHFNRTDLPVWEASVGAAT